MVDLRGHENGEPPVICARLLRELCTGGRQWGVKDRIRMIGGRVESDASLTVAGVTVDGVISLHGRTCGVTCA